MATSSVKLSATPLAKGSPKGGSSKGTAARGSAADTSRDPACSAALRGLRELERQIQGCTACGLHRGRTRPVIGQGPADARLVLLGAAPRQQEDLQGVPFAGAARNVLDHALEIAGLAAEPVRFTTLVRCRPEQDRAPTAHELHACADHLRAELSLVAPEVIVAFGAYATAALYGRALPIERVAGYRLNVLQDVTLIPTYHPVDAVRGVPQAVMGLRRDLAAAKAVLDGRLRTGAQVLADLQATSVTDH